MAHQPTLYSHWYRDMATVFVMHLLYGMRESAAEDNIVPELWPVRSPGEEWARHPAQRVERRDVVESLHNLDKHPAGTRKQQDISGVEVCCHDLVD